MPLDIIKCVCNDKRFYHEKDVINFNKKIIESFEEPLEWKKWVCIVANLLSVICYGFIYHAR